MNLDRIKNGIVTLALFVSGHAVQAQNTGLQNDKSKSNTEQIASSASNSRSFILEDDASLSSWEKTDEGKEIIEAQKEVMKEHGVNYKLSPEDSLYLRKLCAMDKRIGAFATEIKENYQLSPADLIQMKPDSICDKSAESTKMFRRGGLKGYCYWSVKRTDLVAFPLAYAEGMYAREAIAWYDKNPNFVHVVIDHKDTDKLVEGTTVVMDPGVAASTQASHTYKIIAGDKKNTYVDENTGKSYEYVVAKQSCDGVANTNTTGLKKGVPYGPKSHAFIIKTAELSPKTCLNILWNKAENDKNDAKQQVRPKQMWEAYQVVVNSSYDWHQEQIKYAQGHFPNYDKKQQNVQEVDTVRFNKVQGLGETLPAKHKAKKSASRSERRSRGR